MFARLLAGPIAKAVAARLQGAAPGWVVVVSQSRIGDLLRESGHQVVLVEPSAKRLRRVRGLRLVASLDALPMAPRSVTALVVADRASGLEVEGWSAVVRDGGVVALLGNGDRQQRSAVALTAGLLEIEQARLGRTVLTTGVVRYFEPGAPAARDR